MGFWNDGWGGGGGGGSRARSRSRSRSPPSRTQSRTHSHARAPSRTYSTSSNKHYSSRPSLARSASSFFSMGGGTARGRSSSYSSSRARPRSGFVARVRKFLRQVYEYMKKHPVKVFVLVIMPLITGGALTKLLSTVGVRMPASLERVVGSSMNRGYPQSERLYARGGARDFGGGSALPGMGGGMGDTIQGALSIAKMFM